MYREMICNLQNNIQAEVDRLNERASELRMELDPLQCRVNSLNQMLAQLGNCAAWVGNVEAKEAITP